MNKTIDRGLRIDIAEPELRYFFLVVDDNPGNLATNTSILEEIVHDNPDFARNYRASNIEIVSANSTSEIEPQIENILAQDPPAVLVGLFDERMPGERGTAFIDRLRYKHPGSRIGAILVTGYAEDVEVINARDHGVFRFIEKGDTDAEPLIVDAIDDVINHLFIREKAKGKKQDDFALFKIITDPNEFEEYLGFRFEIWSKDNLLDPRNDSGYDITHHDRFSIPYAGYLHTDQGMRMIAALRTITRSPIQHYVDMLSEIVRNRNHPYLREAFEREPRHFPTMEGVLEDENIKSEALEHLKQFTANPACIEISRTTTHPDFKGYSFARKVMEFGVADCLKRGYRYAIGSCDTKVNGMYAKFGYWVDEASGLINIKAVAFVSNIVLADFTKLPEPFNTNVNLVRELRATQDFAYVSPQTRNFVKSDS